MKTSLGRLALAAIVLVAGFLVSVPTAQATVVTFSLTSDHCTGGCGSAPYGTVVLNDLSGPNVTVTVTLAAGYSFVETGSADLMNFKFNGVGVALLDIIPAAHVPVLAAATGAFNGDGTGNFAFGIECPSCAGGGAGAFTAPIVFTVNNATIGELTVPNNLGNIFVADVLAPNGNTGPVDVTGVPEPTALLLLAAGLVGLGISRHRLLRK